MAPLMMGHASCFALRAPVSALVDGEIDDVSALIKQGRDNGSRNFLRAFHVPPDHTELTRISERAQLKVGIKIVSRALRQR